MSGTQLFSSSCKAQNIHLQKALREMYASKTNHLVQSFPQNTLETKGSSLTNKEPQNGQCKERVF